MQKPLIILLHAFIGWMLCAAIISVGFQLITEKNALIIHALGAPIVFAVISLVLIFSTTYLIGVAIIIFTLHPAVKKHYMSIPQSMRA